VKYVDVYVDVYVYCMGVIMDLNYRKEYWDKGGGYYKTVLYKDNEWSRECCI